MSMSMADRDTKTGCPGFPQQVPWSNANETRQEGRNPGVKSFDIMEDQGLKGRKMVSSSRVQADGTPPVELGAPDLSPQGHLNDVRVHEATNSGRQGNHNGGSVPAATNSRRQGHHMDDRVPGAVLVPGIDEGISRHDEDQSFANDRRHNEDSTNESNENSSHAITARVVDQEEEHRVLREQLHQVLQEEREHAVVHTATITRGVDNGDKPVVEAAANDNDGDVECGNVTVRQAPTININASIQQAPINVDHPKIVGFWHGTRGRLVIAALILVIVATAVGVTLALLLPGEDTPQSDQLNDTGAIEPTLEPPIGPTPPPTTSGPTDTTTPTPPASRVDNFDCSNAWPNPIDGKIYAGSNVNGTDEFDCWTGYEDFGPSAWYRFIGNGRPVKVSTCNKNTTGFYTVLSVSSSTDGTCDELFCIGTVDGFDDPFNRGCPAEPFSTGSTVNIPTTSPSLVYFVSVIGHEGKVGEFGLTIFDDSVGCEYAKDPHPVDGEIYAGSNVNGTIVSSCNTGYGSFGPGAWYRFIGNGGPITVSTCNKNTTAFPTVLSVLSSTDETCSPDKLDKQFCEFASGFEPPVDSGCPAEALSKGSTVSLDTTVLGKVYFVSVIGHEGAVGEFGLQISGDIPAGRRILPEVLAPSVVNEVISDRTGGSFTGS